MGRWPEGPEGQVLPARRPDRFSNEMLRTISACFVALSLLAACSQTPPPALVTVPDLIGKPLPQAEAELQAAGLRSDAKVGDPRLACSPIIAPSPTPAVSDQKPAPGRKSRKGQSLCSVTHISADGSAGTALGAHLLAARQATCMLRDRALDEIQVGLCPVDRLAQSFFERSPGLEGKLLA